MKVTLHGQSDAVLKNLPGQRLGAKSWYWLFRQFLRRELGFEFCIEQPCLGRVGDAVILLHADDVLYCGSSTFFQDKSQSKFQ